MAPTPALAPVEIEEAAVKADPDLPPAPVEPHRPSVLPEVRTFDDIARWSGEVVYVFGTYEQVAVSPLPGATPKGRVALQLADDGRVFLFPPWHRDGIRPADERVQYSGREVVVMGLLYGRCPRPPGDGAYITNASCLDLADIVVDAELHRSLHAPFEPTDGSTTDATRRQ